MRDREVNLLSLESEIARRAVMSIPEGKAIGPAGLPFSLSARMYTQAMKLLREGQFAAAATLFEFAISQNSRDAGAENNLGFCLMPEDAAAALEHLERATHLSYESPFINLHNRATCEMRLDHPAAALKLIEEGWGDGEYVGTATLWVISDGELVLTERADVVREVATLAAQAAEKLGHQEDQVKWESLAA